MKFTLWLLIITFLTSAVVEGYWDVVQRLKMPATVVADPSDIHQLLFLLHEYAVPLAIPLGCALLCMVQLAAIQRRERLAWR